MQFHPNELFLIYDPQSNVGRQTKAMALDLCSHINEVDVTREKFSPTYWKEVVAMLGIHPRELIDTSDPEFKKGGDNSYTMDGWLNVLAHHGSLVKYPIVIYLQSAILCKTPTDIMKLKGKSVEKTLPHLKNYR
jgi:arsenate reductase